MKGAIYGRYNELSTAHFTNERDPSPIALSHFSNLQSNEANRFVPIGHRPKCRSPLRVFGSSSVSSATSPAPAWGNELMSSPTEHYQLQQQNGTNQHRFNNGHMPIPITESYYDNMSGHNGVRSQNSNRSASALHKERPDYLAKEQPFKNHPLTKQVDQLIYHLPDTKRYARSSWNYAPEFIKVFSDVRIAENGRAMFDCVLIGSPRPKVCWLFNNETLNFNDVELEDTSDLCRITIKSVGMHHYGRYTVLAENELGRAVTSAALIPPTPARKENGFSSYGVNQNGVKNPKVGFINGYESGAVSMNGSTNAQWATDTSPDSSSLIMGVNGRDFWQN